MMITAIMHTIEIPSIIDLQPLTNQPQRPANRAVAATMNQRILLASCLMDENMEAGIASGGSFGPNL